MRFLRSLARPAIVLLAVVALGGSLSAQGTIRGVVTDSLITRAPLEGATVILQGAPHTAVTDRLGRFVMRDVPAGSFTIGFFHPSLDSLEASAPVRRVVVEQGKTAIVALGMPTANSLSLSLCGKDLDRATSVVFGIVRDAERAQPLEGAVVRAHWFQWTLLDGVAQEARRVESDTVAADGRYVLCGVPNDIALSLTAIRDDRMTGELTLALDHIDFGRRDLLVSASDTAARVPPPISSTDTMPWRRPPGLARLRVRVVGPNGRPVPGATVGIRGTAVNGTTDADGTVRLAAIPAGSQPLLVRRPGSEPVERIVPLTLSGDNELTIAIGRTVVLLPTVAVTGQRVATLDREIGTRVTTFNGRLFTEREIRGLSGGGLAGWTKVPGLRVINDGFDALPIMQNSRMEPCMPNLFLNGSHIYNWSAWELRTMLLGAKRMEIYPRPAMQPPQFLNTTDCGTIVVWT